VGSFSFFSVFTFEGGGGAWVFILNFKFINYNNFKCCTLELGGGWLGGVWVFIFFVTFFNSRRGEGSMVFILVTFLLFVNACNSF